MGSTWLMVIRSMLLAVTTLPCFTVRLPVRPLMGERIVGEAELNLGVLHGRLAGADRRLRALDSRLVGVHGLGAWRPRWRATAPPGPWK